MNRYATIRKCKKWLFILSILVKIAVLLNEAQMAKFKAISVPPIQENIYQPDIDI